MVIPDSMPNGVRSVSSRSWKYCAPQSSDCKVLKLPILVERSNSTLKWSVRITACWDRAKAAWPLEAKLQEAAKTRNNKPASKTACGFGRLRISAVYREAVWRETEYGKLVTAESTGYRGRTPGY